MESPDTQKVDGTWLFCSLARNSQETAIPTMAESPDFRYTFRMPPPKSLSTIHLSTAQTWRGGENQLLLLAKGLLSCGHQALIVTRKGAPLLERAKEEGVPTKILTISGELDPVGTWRLSRLLRELSPDILHLHDAHSVLPGQLAGRVLPAEKLGVIAHRRTSFPIRSRWKYAGRVNRIIAISEAARQRVVEVGIEKTRTSVVYSGLVFPSDLEEFRSKRMPFRKELGLKENDILFAHAAAFTKEKRQDDLIKAFSKAARCAQGSRDKSRHTSKGSLKAGDTPDVHLAIAGKGNLENDLRDLARREGVASQVHFLGFRKDLGSLWAGSDAAIFCSDNEGLCTALVEAQGAGLPAVITRAGGMVEVVEDGVTGRIVEVGNIGALADALLNLADNSELRARLGIEARQRALGLFSAEAMVDGTISVYRSLFM